MWCCGVRSRWCCRCPSPSCRVSSHHQTHLLISENTSVPTRSSRFRLRITLPTSRLITLPTIWWLFSCQRLARPPALLPARHGVLLVSSVGLMLMLTIPTNTVPHKYGYFQCELSVNWLHHYMIKGEWCTQFLSGRLYFWTPSSRHIMAI